MVAHSAPGLHHEYDRYLVTARDHGCKLDYWNGLMLAMAGGTPGLSARSARLALILGAQLQERSTVYTSDAKIRIRNAEHDVAVYPDVSVVCGPAALADDDQNGITNPSVIVEVLSPGTEDYDRADKLAAYQSVPSVREVMFVSHDTECVEVVRRQGSEEPWVTVSARAGQSVRLVSIGCDVAVSSVYVGGAARGL